MSFWDSIKPSKPQPIPTDLTLSEDKREVSLVWSDGASTRISAQVLRQLCPCAGCVDEWTQKRTLDPARVPPTTSVESMQPIGNYAVSFVFSDGHSTGIFDWPMLRETSETLSGAPGQM